MYDNTGYVILVLLQNTVASHRINVELTLKGFGEVYQQKCITSILMQLQLTTKDMSEIILCYNSNDYKRHTSAVQCMKQVEVL